MAVIIDGVTYNVGVKSIKRTADFLDKYANRTETGSLERELIGVYISYELEFAPTKNSAAYAALWDKLTEPKEFHEVVVPTETWDYTFTAYFSGVKDEFLQIKDGRSSFQGLTVKFTSKAPTRS